MELEYPVRIVHPADWAGHIPFAFWAVDNFRPGTLVELGVGSGNSYFAFLQAARKLKLSTRCFGFRLEQGTPVGVSGATFNALKAYHDPLYDGISTLVCSDVDAAKARSSLS